MRKWNHRLLLLLVLGGMSMHVFGGVQQRSVQTLLASLEASSEGQLGLAAIDTTNNRKILYRANAHFPMGCTSKVMGVAAILKKSMSNTNLLQEKIRYQKTELTNWTPITEKHVNDGMTVAELCAAAISYSDNTAMNLLTKRLGGPQGLNAFARSIQDKAFQLNHWWPDEALSNLDTREDESTPEAMAISLRKLVLGRVLAKPQRDLLTTWLKNNVTGKTRIRAGLPQGWVVGDKTGSGFDYGTTNDIAVIWPPKREPIILAIFYSSHKKDTPKRDDIIAEATRIVIKDLIGSDKSLDLDNS